MVFTDIIFNFVSKVVPLLTKITKYHQKLYSYNEQTDTLLGRCPKISQFLKTKLKNR